MNEVTEGVCVYVLLYVCIMYCTLYVLEDDDAMIDDSQ